MPERKLEFSFEEALARRLSARAAFTGESLARLVNTQLQTWLGDWGLRFVEHTVRGGETLSSIARTYYQDGTKAAAIAAFNDVADPRLLRVGQVLRIPEVQQKQEPAPTPPPLPSQPLPKGESPYLFGLHDRGGEHYMAWAGRKGWVLCTEEIGYGRNDWGARSYADLADNGYGVMVRLNNGYGEKGTLPRSPYYEDFAIRCGNFVERSSGCHIWIIGNEMNVAVERPGGPANGEWITPERYVRAFRACRKEIRRRAGHSADQVIPGAIGPWNVQTSYPGNPGGDWIVYFQDVLKGLQGELDGIAIHTYARDANPANIVSELTMDPPYGHRRKMFRTYIDFMLAIPIALKQLPVYITETDQNIAWDNANRGWIQEAYAEINRWNSDPTHQTIRNLILYRWERHDIWYINGKSEVINDMRAALARDYRWHS